MPFNILIIGGGLGGLATATSLSQAGHRVTVLESTSKLQTIGGGITIPSNSMRCWDYLGLNERLHEAAEAKTPERRRFLRYTGDFICDAGTREKLYKYNAIVVHRAPLQQLLVQAATEAGAVIKTNARVVNVDESSDSPAVITKDGQRIEADLIIGADGAKSTIRALLHPNIQLKSEYNIYRAVIPGSTFKADPELAPLLDCSTIWWGPHRAIVGIPVQNGEFYSLECCHPGNTGTAGEWNKKGDINLMKETYSDFEPIVAKMMELVKPDELLVWKLNSLPELASWVFKSGKVVLLGDSAHAMLPFSGEGHAMAIEDSICLAECLSRASSTSDIPKSLKMFETIRKPRTSLISAFGESMARTWQLPDGEEQRQRDEIYRKTPYFGTTGWDGKHVDELPGLPPDPLFFPYMLAHDVVDFTKRQLDAATISQP
ncbi:FAD/NAD(P)-binding domain-containing protein [Acephala macrosclerotiorum]|nr:FAD/NAD(P)-binding domain-containing protein [Acephala macrosclerotiorum]